MRVVRVGVDEADRERLHAPAGQPAQRGARAVLVQRSDLGAVGADPPGHLNGVLQVGEGFGLGPDDPAG